MSDFFSRLERFIAEPGESRTIRQLTPDATTRE
jgi:hypothetical protein